MDTQVAAGPDAADAAPGASLTTNLQRVFNSGIRLSGAASMYSYQQFETAVGNLQAGREFSGQLTSVNSTFENVTQCLVDGMSEGKKQALESMSSVSSQLVRQSLEGLSMFDPREMLRVANNLAQKSSETVSNWVARKPFVRAEEPKLAAEVLAG